MKIEMLTKELEDVLNQGLRLDWEDFLKIFDKYDAKMITDSAEPDLWYILVECEGEYYLLEAHNYFGYWSISHKKVDPKKITARELMILGVKLFDEQYGPLEKIELIAKELDLPCKLEEEAKQLYIQEYDP